MRVRVKDRGREVSRPPTRARGSTLRIAELLWFLSVSLWLVAVPLPAQEYRFHFHGAAEGLANLAIKNLYQDPKGFLWVSTENGIFRYDAERFQEFGRDEGIPFSSGAAFGEAPDGSLLVGGETGLYHLVGNHFEPIPLPGSPSVSWMNGVKSDGGSRTFLATNAGLMVLTRSRENHSFRVLALSNPPGVTGREARGILVEKNAVWYGCGKELCRLSGEQTRVFHNADGLRPATWVPVGRTANGDLWVRGTGVGIAVLRAGEAVFQERQAPVASFGLTGMSCLDSAGNVILPSPDGLFIWRKDAWWKVGRPGGLRGAVYSVLQDRDGSLWIGLAGRGLARWAGYGEWESYSTDSGLGSDLVYQILPRPDGTVFAGTESGLSVGRLNGGVYTWRKQPGIGNTPVHSVRADSEGTLWIGTETRGIARLNPATGSLDWIGSAQGLDAKSPYSLLLDTQNHIWAASESGLFVADLPFHSFRLVAELPRTRFWSVVETSHSGLDSGGIWAGGANGLFHLTAPSASKANRWDQITTKEGLSHNEVLSLGAGPEGDVWIGYRFGGEIDRIRPGHGSSVERSSVDRSAIGFGGYTVEHVARHQTGGTGLSYFLGFDARNRLWAGTEHGVDVWEQGQWTHLDSNDGLAWDDCDLNGFAAESDGSVWIGTSGGLARYTPRPHGLPGYRSAAVFTSLTLGSREVTAGDSPSVDYRSNRLIARFSALNFLRANTLPFRYRLSPLFTDWQTTDRTELEFPGLPPGEYRLELQARVPGGTWSQDSASFTFVIRSPWFRSWWFIAGCLLAPLFLFALGIKVRMAVARVREQELLALVEQRTADLRQANQDLVRLSSLDGLTGVANRRAFDRTLEREWAAMKRTGQPLSLLLLDVDHFKILNDSEGHQRGDECLVLLASEFRRLTQRTTDMVARYGGEEFVIVLAATEAEAAMRFAESACEATARLRLRNINSPLAPIVTISIGVATALPGLFNTHTDFLAAADQALYEAKRAGRNRAVFSQSTILSRAS